MSKPTVCVVMLVNGREAMVRRAIASYRAQTYQRKRLLIYANGPVEPAEYLNADAIYTEYEPVTGKTIGWLRNQANEIASRLNPDIIAHFDSDDWSHPRRLEEQVALLQSSGAECVGYREVLFWDTRPGAFCGAWVYANHDARYGVDASRMMWRGAWEKARYDDAPYADQRWWLANAGKCVGISATAKPGGCPRLICQIHDDNMSEAYQQLRAPTWRCAPEWDGFCKAKMEEQR